MKMNVRLGTFILRTQPRPPPLSSKTWLFRHASGSAFSRGGGSSSGWVSRRAAIFASLGSVAGLTTAVHWHTSSAALCRTHSSSSSIPHLTLYEFPSCPFCGKVKAFLNYHGVDYTAVSVNPVSRKEIQFSKSKKLPLIVVDGEKIQDSSLVVSVLQTSMERGLSVSECLKFYPQVNVTTTDGENTTEHSNRYFIMYGEEGQARSVGELREEREWRQWVDDELVHTLPPNIYRTLSEARQTLAFIAERSSMTTFQRLLARNVAPIALYYIGKRNIKKYKLKPDARESLYDCCNQWVEAIGQDRLFMGGAAPNLADLAVYGALSATEGLATFRDMQAHTNIGPWYTAMRELVNRPRPMN